MSGIFIPQAQDTRPYLLNQMRNFLKGLFPPTRADYSRGGDTTPAWVKDKRVLFLDDDPASRHILDHVSKKFNMALFLAESIASARTVIESVDRSTPPGESPFDVMIFDIVLTNGLGIELYREVYDRWPKTHVVFITGYDPDVYRHQVEEIGPARIHTKGIMLEMRFVEALFNELGITRKCVAE